MALERAAVGLAGEQSGATWSNPEQHAQFDSTLPVPQSSLCRSFLPRCCETLGPLLLHHLLHDIQEEDPLPPIRPLQLL